MPRRFTVGAIAILFLLAALLVALWSGGEAHDPESVMTRDMAQEMIGGTVTLGDVADVGRERLRSAMTETTWPPHGSIEVCVVWAGEDSPIAGLSVSIARDVAGELVVVQNHTDAEGRVRFAGLAPGTYFARASMDAVRPVVVVAGGGEEVLLEVIGYAKISGCVIDMRDQPVAGATLWMSGWGALVGQGQVGVSDADGRFSFRSPAVNVALYAEKAGMGRSRELGVLSFPDEEMRVDLRLGEGAMPLSGVVVDERGRPVVGAQITSHSRGPEPPGPYAMLGHHIPKPSTSSDRNGRFTMPNVLPGRVQCWARAKGFLRSDIDFEHRGDEVRLIMKRGGTLLGVVRDDDGQPIFGATIANAQFGRDRLSVRSDANGKYALTALGPGEQEFSVSHPRHGRASARFTIGANGRNIWDVRLDPGLILQGRVIDEAGKPLQGWFLRATARRQPSREAYTDRNGRFAIPVAADAEHRVILQEAAYLNSPTRGHTNGVRPSDGPIEFVVSEATRASAYLVGRYLRPAGFEDSLLRFLIYDPSQESHWSGSYGVGFDGIARFGPLSPGRYMISLNAFRTALGGATIGPFEVHAGETFDFGVIELPTPTTFSMRCQMDGLPFRHALNVEFRPHDSDHRSFSRMWNNGFVDEAWLPGRYTFEIQQGETHSKATAEIEILAGQRNQVQVALEPRSKE